MAKNNGDQNGPVPGAHSRTSGKNRSVEKSQITAGQGTSFNTDILTYFQSKTQTLKQIMEAKNSYRKLVKLSDQLEHMSVFLAENTTVTGSKISQSFVRLLKQPLIQSCAMQRRRQKR